MQWLLTPESMQEHQLCEGGVSTLFERSSGGGLISALTTTLLLPLSNEHLQDAKT